MRPPALPPRRVLLVWILTRLVLLLLLFGPESGVVGDVVYFSHSLRDLSDVGLGHAMPEYPVAAVMVSAVPWWAAAALGSTALYGFILAVLMLVTDAAFTWVLSCRRDDPGRAAALLSWLAAVPALGALDYAKIDLVPGVLVGCVVLLAGSRPRAGGVLVAVATSIKLWPILLLPALLARTRRRGPVIAVVAAIGAVAVGATVALAGWARVFSPLAYQADRGVQIESLAATPAMAAWALDPASWRIFYSPFKAFEVDGPGVWLLALLTTLATCLLLAGLSLVWVSALRRPGGVSTDALVWMCLVAVTGFVCVGKVLSPQYLLWLLPAASAGLAVLRTSRRRLVRWTVVLLAAAGLSHALFPWLYVDLVEHGPHSWAVVLVLVVRNAAMLWLLVEAARATLAALGPAGESEIEAAAPPDVRPATT